MKKSMVLLGVFLVGILAMSGFASASFSGLFTDVNVEVNDVDLDEVKARNIEKADELDVIVKLETADSEAFQAQGYDGDIEDLQISIEVDGYDKSDAHLLEDESDLTDVGPNEVITEDLNLGVPVRMEKGVYNLKVRIDSKTESETYLFPFKIESMDEFVEIRDVIWSPSNGVKAGRALLATVRIANRGNQDEDEVKVSVDIPELGIKASDWVDELMMDEDDDDSKSSEELYLRVPECAEAGLYEAIVEVEYDDGDEVERQKMTIEVLANEACKLADTVTDKPVIYRSSLADLLIRDTQEPYSHE